MKYIKHTLILSATVAMLACTGDYEDYNNNPNKLPSGSISPISMLEPLIYSPSKSHSRYMLEIANEISQVTVAKSNPRQEHRYNIDNGNYLNIWNLCYDWAGNADHMRKLAVAQGQPNFIAIGLTLKVYHLSILSDMFGAVAYREALLADEGVRTPHIDSQKEVYEAMMADLETANSLYNPAIKIDTPSKDGIYGGEIALWKKFTNTLHLRLLMRVSGRNGDFTPMVSERINKIISDPATYPVFESNADNAAVKYSGTTDYYRGYFNVIDFADDKQLSSDHHVSSQFLGMIYDKAAGFEDPRMRIWIKPRYTDSEILPMDGALSGSTVRYNDNPDHNKLEPFLHYESLVNNTNPEQMINYDELLFIKAEAALNGWIAGSAKEYYEAAIEASMEKWGQYGQRSSYPNLINGKIVFLTVTITPTMVNDFLQNERVAWNGTQQRLAEQKWLSLFWIPGFQMYHEMRRTGYPACKTGQGVIELGRTNGKFIARYAYPLIAIANNRENYEAAFSEQGGSIDSDNNMIFPVWWSGQAVAKDAGSPWEHSFRKNEIAEEN